MDTDSYIRAAHDLAKSPELFLEWARAHRLNSDYDFVPLPASLEVFEKELLPAAVLPENFFATDAEELELISSIHPFSHKELDQIRSKFTYEQPQPHSLGKRSREDHVVRRKRNDLFISLVDLFLAVSAANELDRSNLANEDSWRSVHHRLIKCAYDFAQKAFKYDTLKPCYSFGNLVKQAHPFTPGVIQKKLFPRYVSQDAIGCVKFKDSDQFINPLRRTTGVSHEDLFILDQESPHLNRLTQDSSEFPLFAFFTMQSKPRCADMKAARNLADMATVAMLRHQSSHNICLPVYQMLAEGKTIALRHAWWEKKKDDSGYNLYSFGAHLREGHVQTYDVTNAVDALELFIVLVNIFSCLPKNYFDAAMMQRDKTILQARGDKFRKWSLDSSFSVATSSSSTPIQQNGYKH